MAKKNIEISRRDFLKTSAALGVSALAVPYIRENAFAATRDRVTVYQNTQADSINPYQQSSGSIYGNWQHVIEPLVELDYAKKAWVGVLAESWEFQGKRWVFKLRKGVKFHNGAPLTSRDVVFSVEKMRDEKGGSLQASNFSDVTEIQTPDDQTVIFVTKQPLAIFLDRLRNRYLVSKVAGDKFGDQLYQNLVGTGPYKFVSFQRGVLGFHLRADERDADGRDRLLRSCAGGRRRRHVEHHRLHRSHDLCAVRGRRRGCRRQTCP